MGRTGDHSLAGRGSGSAGFGNATILLYLAVTFTVQRLVVWRAYSTG